MHPHARARTIQLFRHHSFIVSTGLNQTRPIKLLNHIILITHNLTCVLYQTLYLSSTHSCQIWSFCEFSTSDLAKSKQHFWRPVKKNPSSDLLQACHLNLVSDWIIANWGVASRYGHQGVEGKVKISSLFWWKEVWGCSSHVQ